MISPYKPPFNKRIQGSSCALFKKAILKMGQLTMGQKKSRFHSQYSEVHQTKITGISILGRSDTTSTQAYIYICLHIAFVLCICVCATAWFLVCHLSLLARLYMDGRTTIVLSGASFKGLDTNSPQIKNSAIDNWLCHARNLCPSKRGQPMSFQKRAANVLPKEGNQCPSKRGQPMS